MELRAVTVSPNPISCTCKSTIAKKPVKVQANVFKEKIEWVHSAECTLTDKLLQEVAEAGVC